MNPPEMLSTSDSHNNIGGGEDWEEGKEKFWCGTQLQFADKQTTFKSNLQTNRRILEFCQQYNAEKHY